MFSSLTQISFDNGFKKLNIPAFCFCFLAMIEMPSDINGLLKSITRSRSDVIVIGAMAISASCKTMNANELIKAGFFVCLHVF